MTVQIPDSLDIEGMPAMIGCDVFIELCPRIVRLDDEAASASYPGAFSTNCHRDFLANWAIEGGIFYLIDVICIYNLIGEELLFAEWYSGTIQGGARKCFQSPRLDYDFSGVSANLKLK